MKKITIGVIVFLVILACILLLSPAKPSLQTVGVIIPHSGPAATIGEAMKRALELTPLKHITLTYEDDQCDAKKAISAYNALKLKGVKIYIVGCSGSVLALAPLIQADGNLLLTSYAGSSEIRKTGPEVIRFIPDALSVTEAMEGYISKIPHNRYGILYEQQDYAQSVANTMKEILGDKVTVTEGYNGKDISFKSNVLKFKNTVDALILIPVSDKAEKTILTEMSVLNIKPYIIGDINVCDFAFKPSDVGIKGVCFKAQLTPEKEQEFNNLYTLKYNKPSEYLFYDAATFDLVTILDEILQKQRTIPDIQDTILEGVTGPISSYTFDSMGEVQGGEYLRQVEF